MLERDWKALVVFMRVFGLSNVAEFYAMLTACGRRKMAIIMYMC